jgi:hypothetical protein
LRLHCNYSIGLAGALHSLTNETDGADFPLKLKGQLQTYPPETISDFRHPTKKHRNNLP